MSRVRLFGAFPLPFEIPEVTSGEVGFDTFYPFGLSLDDIIKAYWRVKKWKVTINTTDTTTGDPGNGYGTDYFYSGEDEVLGQSPPDNERGLIVPVCSTFTSTNDNEFGVRLFDNTEDGGWVAPCVRQGDLFYPAAILNTQDYGSISGFGTHENVTITFMSASVPCKGVSFLTGSVVIVPEEYWTYDGIYDATTGAQLLDPLTASFP